VRESKPQQKPAGEHGRRKPFENDRADAKTPFLEQFARRLQARPFIAPALLRNRHLMTIIGTKRPRRFSILPQPSERREFDTEPGIRVVAYCHWQPEPRAHPTIVIIHGLEGSAEGAYVLGTAEKAFAAGFNALRYNVRGCGGTSQLSSKLYHSGLTTDLHAVMQELIERDGLPELYVVGFSMGGNQTLKFAGELGSSAPVQIRGVCAISPPVDLESCSRSIMMRENWIYESNFLISLRKTLIEKDRLFPGVYDTGRLKEVRHLWDWDEIYQRHNGFNGALDYYARASSIDHLPQIRIPTLIIHAEDDPFIPFDPFRDPRVTDNPNVLLVGTSHGGHVAFTNIRRADEDRAWAENRAVDFCRFRATNDCD
jgi:uncharacterized protein